jgi:hypothetical protein
VHKSREISAKQSDPNSFNGLGVAEDMSETSSG